MLVKELIEELKNCDENRLVVLSSDEEGNKFHTVVSVEEVGYNTEDNEVCIERLTPELEKNGYCEEDILEKQVPALIIWP